MAKLLDSKSALKQSDSDKAAVAAGKAVIAQCKRGDVVALKRYRDTMNSFIDTLTQEGESVGKRFNGATGHDLTAQLAALESIIVRGNVPTIG